MGFRLRKSIKIVPGVRINLTKKGVSSLSVGKRGARVNIGKKGTRGTVGIPGSGLSYSSYKSHSDSKRQPPQSLAQNNSTSTRSPPPSIHDIDTVTAHAQRRVSILLGIGILLVPIIFAWFTLRQGYSTVSRAISMVWMVIVIFSMR
ncbi:MULTISPECIES: DUF4236 domain-containing protein [Psychrobacter]|uniref:DUF4236 domain-containing protein n=1 Tax=Psychrobacter TaxID=497 RepID=UPI00191A4349|nr:MULTISPECIES: DUF4236 domain-containing protein [Psychrobacter]